MYSKDVEMSMLAESAWKLAHKLVFDQWHNSSGHLLKILYQNYKTIGAAGLIRMKYSRDRFGNCQGVMENY